MTRTADMSRTPIKPYLIAKDENGAYRLTIRETRFNSQYYPIVTCTVQEETFKTAAAARAHAQQHFGAVPGDFASK